MPEVKPNQLAKALETRIFDRIKRMNPDDPRSREALLRIGIKLETETKKNIRREGLIDTGTLLNSIRYQLYQETGRQGVKVGSFGVPYAATHEFGFTGVVNIPSHARTRNGKTHQVRQHTRYVNFPERAYLRPAIKNSKNEILQILRNIFRK